MARKAHVVTIHGGPVRTGGWCDRCQLPSLIEFDMMTLTDDGVNILGHIRRCVEEASD